MSHLGECVRYESVARRESRSEPGVWYAVRKMSLQRRAEITRRVRSLLAQLKCKNAGEELDERLEAAHLAAEIDKVYLEWGLDSIEGLEIDGVPATLATLVEKGPERLCREIAAATREQCHLSEEERKN